MPHNRGGTAILVAASNPRMDHDAWRRFDEFALNIETGELRRDGVPVPIERQPARVLALLVSRAGELVTRTELQRLVWGTDIHVDFERGLNYCLRQIRIALGDDARSPRFVETLPRRGYRFIKRDVTEPAALPVSATRRPWLIIGAAALALSIWIEAGSTNDAHHRLAVAVLRSVHDFLF